MQETKQIQRKVDGLINPTAIIDSFHSSVPENELLIEDIFSLNPLHKCFLLGRNNTSRKLLEWIKVDGIVDDYEQQETTWLNKKIIPSSEIPPKSIVINCSLSISPVSAMKQLLKQKQAFSVPYSDLIKSAKRRALLPEFVLDAREDISVHWEKYEDIFSILTDSESTKAFNSLISYRLTSDFSYMENYSVRLNDQYFEPFLGDLKDINFLDCGGYDGDTTEEFIKRYSQYSKIFFFEPCKTNMRSACERLKHFHNIEFIPKGVSNTSGTLAFDSTLGSACNVSPNGSTFITVTTIDETIGNIKSFIKMDLEGWELNALAGAEKHITKSRPILAIAVYHTVSDFWKIPNFILNLNPNYKIYLRHYTEGWSETVMYFVPN